MKISTRARYALRLMIDITDNGGRSGPIQLRNIADRQNISKRYLEQLVIALRNASLIKSVSGPQGGYLLTRPPGEIKAGEIIEATIGPIYIIDCLKDATICSESTDCKSRAMWLLTNKRIRDTIFNFTLQDLVDGNMPHPVVTDLDGKDGENSNPCQS